MVSKQSKLGGLWKEVRELLYEQPTSPSLFHYIDEDRRCGFWSNLDPDLRQHPLKYMLEEWQAPRTRASLFQYIQEPAEPFEWRAFLRDLALGSPPPPFLPPLLSD